MYDLIHLKSNPVELALRYEINYNTVRNMLNLYYQEAGVTFKHQRMYSDINNPIHRIAGGKDAELLPGKNVEADLGERREEDHK